MGLIGACLPSLRPLFRRNSQASFVAKIRSLFRLRLLEDRRKRDPGRGEGESPSLYSDPISGQTSGPNSVPAPISSDERL